MPSYKNVTFFQGLNGLRFFAALFVLIQHSERLKHKNGIYNVSEIGFFSYSGTYAVTFFFVLSGFLITYLLLKEERKTHTINIGFFYLKRVLRIWPLYFLLVIIGLIIGPLAIRFFTIAYQMPYDASEVWYYFLFFLPLLVTFYFGSHFLEPLWSIGVEEIFYLIWAPLFSFFKRKLLLLFIGIIILKIILNIAAYYFQNPLFSYLVRMLQFESMAIGGLGAYFIFTINEHLHTHFLYRRWIQIPCYCLLTSLLFFRNSIAFTPFIYDLMLSFLFIYLIIDIALRPHPRTQFLQHPIFNFLGDISYGIYMYHMLVIFIVLQGIKKIGLPLSPFFMNIIFYTFTLLLVIGISTLSKLYFENYFLHLKEKFGKNKEASNFRGGGYF